MERDYQWLDGISLTAFSMLETTTNAHVSGIIDRVFGDIRVMVDLKRVSSLVNDS